LAPDAPSFEVHFSNHCAAGPFTRIGIGVCSAHPSWVPQGAWMEEMAFGGCVYVEHRHERRWEVESLVMSNSIGGIVSIIFLVPNLLGFKARPKW
jgi:hypothetical protein